MMIDEIRLPCVAAVAVLTLGCSDDVPSRDDFGSGGGEAGSTSDGGSTTGAAGSGDTADATSGHSTTRGSESDGGGVFDVGAPSEPEVCAGSDPGRVMPCQQQAPPESFEAAVQWSWTDEERPYSVVAPLVGNLTDDNGDGAIDVCDVPDVVVVAYACDAYCSDAHLFVLDGATGTLHFEIDAPVKNAVTPALGDIDDDGIPEIVAVSNENHLVAFEHDGSLAWTGKADGGSLDAIALADFDNDGDVEILHDGHILSDHLGEGLLVAGPGLVAPLAPVAADLDGDDDLEIVLGAAAYHHDGSVYYENTDMVPGSFTFPQVVDLDDDPEPEVLITGGLGISILEHDGTTKVSALAPTGEPLDQYGRPGAIHDFDGDGEPELAVKSEAYYSLIERDGSLVWSAAVIEGSFGSGGTAFDFLGDGTAEAIYADEHTLFAFDELGASLFDIPRTSFTVIEYPVVADVDADGSAEIVVVSNRHQYGAAPSPTVQVIRDTEDRWIPARRIWNQHTYHVTNVREDGTIPQYEPPHWQHLNTFRTQAQTEGGEVCRPEG